MIIDNDKRLVVTELNDYIIMLALMQKVMFLSLPLLVVSHACVHGELSSKKPYAGNHVVQHDDEYDLMAELQTVANFGDQKSD